MGCGCAIGCGCSGYAPAVSQTMKPLTAAGKLGIYLPSTPKEF